MPTAPLIREDLDYRYTKEMDHDEQQWQKIEEMAIQAMNHWLQIPEERRNFDQAKAAFMLHNLQSPPVLYSTHMGELAFEVVRDLKWIGANRAILWLTATVAFEEFSYGFILIDLTEQDQDQGHPLGSYSEGELEPRQGGELRRLLNGYNPDWEFIALLGRVKGVAMSIWTRGHPWAGMWT